MAWFRLQDGILDDPKIQNLPASVFKDWINILCLAKRHDGFIPTLKDVSFAFRVSETDAAKKIKQLKKCGLLDDTKKGMMPHNWLKYQYKSDVSTKRVKQFRKRHETVSRNAPEQNRTETEKKESPQEGAKERTPAKPAPPPNEAADGKPKRKSAKRATQIPENWEPDSTDTAFAIKRGYSVLQIERLADDFLRHHGPIKENTSKDWSASWRTWISRDLKWDGDPGTRGPKHGGADESPGGFAATAMRVVARVEGRGNGMGMSDEVHGAGDVCGRGDSQGADRADHDPIAGEDTGSGTDQAERPDEAPEGGPS